MRLTTFSARRMAPDVGVRAEVARAVVLQPPRHEHARERLLHRDLDVRIRLVVAQRDVEPRAVLLDQVRLEHQGVRLGRDHDRLEIGHPRHQRARLQALASGRWRSSCAHASAAASPCPRTVPRPRRPSRGRRPATPAGAAAWRRRPGEPGSSVKDTRTTHPECSARALHPRERRDATQRSSAAGTSVGPLTAAVTAPDPSTSASACTRAASRIRASSCVP